MKIIYHACTDGYLTEVVFPQGSEWFSTMLDALIRVGELFGKDRCKDIPQERIEHDMNKYEFLKHKKGVAHALF